MTRPLASTLALSLTQPWAHFMLRLPPEHLKGIENRTWLSRFRGDCWVHASKGMTRQDYQQACEFAFYAGVPRTLFPAFAQVERGGIVGRWRIVDVMLPGGYRQDPVGTGFSDHPRKGDRWHMPDQFGYIVEDARPVPFVPCKGALGFWRVPPPVLEQLRRVA